MRILRWAVGTNAKYIGMVGSRRKAITVFRELTREGLKPELFDRVHSPIGLDIGAASPEEIAISILAELIGVRRGVERPLPHMSWFLQHGADPVDAPNPDSAKVAEADSIDPLQPHTAIR